MALRRILHGRGFRYRVDRLLPLAGLRRRADLVFGPARVAVFVDGCFWHGCPDHGNAAVKVNTWYWPGKIAGNRERDRDTDERLRALGWTPVHIWEHESAELAADRVEAVLASRREHRGG